MEPIVVRSVRSRVAKAGWKRAPPRTFCEQSFNVQCLDDHREARDLLTQATLPGTDHACFQTADIDRTPMTCANGHVPLWEYACRSLPIAARSSRVRGHETVTGKDARESTTRNVESGKRMTTKTRGRCVWQKSAG